MALTPLATELDPLPTPSTPSTFEDDMDRFINTKLPLLATEVDAVATAFTLNATNSTSTTSIAIGTGTKNYTVQTSKSYVAGMFVIAADAAAPATNYNYGQVLSYDSGTGALSISVTNTAGSGTKTSWVISQTSPGGASTTGYTSTGDIIVPAETYGAGWNGSNEVPTKNDVYDEIERAASLTAKGRIELATSLEIKAGTDSTRAISTDQLLAAQGFTAYYESTQQTITTGGQIILAHGLARRPKHFQVWLVNQTAESGYTAGMYVQANFLGDDPLFSRGLAVVADATNLTLRYGAATIVFIGLNYTTGARIGFTSANWKLVIGAWA